MWLSRMSEDNIISRWLLDYVCDCAWNEFRSDKQIADCSKLRSLIEGTLRRFSSNAYLQQFQEIELKIQLIVLLCKLSDGNTFAPDDNITENEPTELEHALAVWDQIIPMLDLSETQKEQGYDIRQSIKLQAVFACCRGNNFQTAKMVYERLWKDSDDGGNQPYISSIQTVIKHGATDHTTLISYPFEDFMDNVVDFLLPVFAKFQTPYLIQQARKFAEHDNGLICDPPCDGEDTQLPLLTSTQIEDPRSSASSIPCGQAPTGPDSDTESWATADDRNETRSPGDIVPLKSVISLKVMKKGAEILRRKKIEKSSDKPERSVVQHRNQSVNRTEKTDREQEKSNKNPSHLEIIDLRDTQDEFDEVLERGAKNIPEVRAPSCGSEDLFSSHEDDLLDKGKARMENKRKTGKGESCTPESVIILSSSEETDARVIGTGLDPDQNGSEESQSIFRKCDKAAVQKSTEKCAVKLPDLPDFVDIEDLKITDDQMEILNNITDWTQPSSNLETGNIPAIKPVKIQGANKFSFKKKTDSNSEESQESNGSGNKRKFSAVKSSSSQQSDPDSVQDSEISQSSMSPKRTKIDGDTDEEDCDDQEPVAGPSKKPTLLEQIEIETRLIKSRLATKGSPISSDFKNKFQYKRNQNRPSRYSPEGSGDAQHQVESESEDEVQISDSDEDVLDIPDSSHREVHIAQHSRGSLKSPPRKKILWTHQEIEELKCGVKRFGEGRWAKIKEHFNLEKRSGVQLKDKWRNMKKNGEV